ncbi:hypothetical protein BG015_002955 [Linnemannia schmuckeri]|uniref:Uncharacterized protein n=1 Tax=Linnemannia schmuckeri TaxID=64567 RepID=A0A9P5RMY4_9FUNG|nr:hypothetical protein BG015_002955 [Linnemannia schmuckeri]
MSRLSMSLFSLAVVLALIALATNINAKDSHHLLSHHRRQHPPQQQQSQHQQNHIHHGHHHHPTLAGALFPVTNEILTGKKEYAKEPCPTGCIHHRSDVYLAVTSIGEGSPRIQFTCSHAQPSQPTPNAQYPEDNHQHYQQYHAHHDRSQGDSSNQEPADPIPEHTPYIPSHQGCSKRNHHDLHDRTDDGTNLYTDLHTTADPHLRRSTPMAHKAAAARGYNPHYDFIFSPRERSHSVDLNDDAKSHTTTMTFSADDNKHNEYVASCERRSIPLTDAADDEQDPHRQEVHILPVRDHHHHRLQGATLQGSLVKSGGSGLITPEPTATLAAPTSSYPRGGSNRGAQGVNDDRTVSNVAPVLHGHGHEYKAGPAAPTPEAFPGQTNTGHIHTHDHNYNQGGISVDEKERAVSRGGETPVLRYRTIVHRVTTLIVETETIVNRPTVTPTATAVAFMQKSKGQAGRAQHHYNKKEEQLGRGSHAYGPHIGDHIMFDAGVDGEMIVSIASSDQSSRRSKHKAPLAH